MKKVLVVVLVFAMLFAFAACANEEAPSEKPEVAPAGEAPAEEAPAGEPEETTDEPVEIACIIKATSSDFWQYVLVGAENYGIEQGDAVNVTTYGPATEAEIAEQVTILEGVINSNPDIIVIASTSSDATVDAINDAREKGIVVITVDNKVNTETDSFLATDNKVGGGTAAEQLVKSMMEKQGVDSADALTGKIGIVTAMSGVQVLTDRNEGFATKMAELAPQLEFIETIDINNDMARGVTDFAAMVKANPDLAGVFGDNNTGGNAVANVLEDNNLTNIAAVAYDSDEAEVQAVKDGWLQGIVVQDPYRMGYDGCAFGMDMLLNGTDLPDYVDTGAVLITAENIDDPDSLGLLDPRTRSLK